MIKLSEAVNVIIKNYADFSKCKLTLDEAINFINNLTYNDIYLNNYNFYDFRKYDETLCIFIIEETFDTLIVTIEGIFCKGDWL